MSQRIGEPQPQLAPDLGPAAPLLLAPAALKPNADRAGQAAGVGGPQREVRVRVAAGAGQARDQGRQRPTLAREEDQEQKEGEKEKHAAAAGVARAADHEPAPDAAIESEEDIGV